MKAWGPVGPLPGEANLKEGAADTARPAQLSPHPFGHLCVHQQGMDGISSLLRLSLPSALHPGTPGPAHCYLGLQGWALRVDTPEVE